MEEPAKAASCRLVPQTVNRASETAVSAGEGETSTRARGRFDWQAIRYWESRDFVVVCHYWILTVEDSLPYVGFAQQQQNRHDYFC